MNIPRGGLVASVVVFLAMTPPSVRAAGQEPLQLDFDGPGWEFTGDGTIVEELDGKKALRLVSGKATYRDLEFLDGTIEFDLRTTEYRSFAYLYFRMQDDDEHEEIYFRPHKSMLPDAIQYTPVYKGSSQWQLYHDARSTAAAYLPPDEWTRIKLVVQGDRAAVFVGPTEEPQLMVPHLAREPKSGFIALRSFMTFGTPPETHVANFANVVVHPGKVDYEFPAAEPSVVQPDQIPRWQISPPFVPVEGPTLELPADVMDSSDWQAVSTNADGLVELERHVTRPEGVRRVAVLARLRIVADKTSTRRLDLGFSDELSVFFNGRLLVTDDESYSFNFPRRQGLLTGEQLSVYLPLEPGANEIVLSITDRFGGWGLSGKLEGREELIIATE